MADIFRSEVEFGALIQDTALQGWAFCPEALTREYRQELLGEVQTDIFKPYLPQRKVVSEEYDYLDNPTALDSVAELGEVIGHLIRLRRGRYEALDSWVANDVSVQRYGTDTAGIGPHFDYSWNRLLIVSVTLQGCSKIGLYGNKEDIKPFKELETGPGSLVLLRAPGILPGGDGRIRHSVSPPIGRARIAIIYRYKSK